MIRACRFRSVVAAPTATAVAAAAANVTLATGTNVATLRRGLATSVPLSQAAAASRSDEPSKRAGVIKLDPRRNGDDTLGLFKIPEYNKRPTFLGKSQEFEIRHATSKDLERVIDFEQRLSEETEGKRVNDKPLRHGCLGALAAPHLAHVALAHRRDDPEACVGYLALSKQWSVWHGGYMNYILSVFVDSSCRGTGLFTDIFGHAQNMVRGDRMSIGVRLNVDAENAQAIRAYEKHGMSIEPLDLYKWAKPLEELPVNCGQPQLPSADPALPRRFPSANPWKLRRATAADIEAIVEMQIAAAAEADITADEVAVRRGVTMPWVEPYIARVYVAELDGKIIATTFVTNEWNTWQGGIIYWLSGCYTAPEYREHGVMKSLYKFCMSEVKQEKHAAGIRMAVPRGNEKAAGAARSIGLKKENYNLMTWVDPAGAGSRKFVN